MHWVFLRLRIAGVCVGIFAAGSIARADQEPAAGIVRRSVESGLSIEWPPVAERGRDSQASATAPPVQATGLSLAPDVGGDPVPNLSHSVLEACACGCGVFDVATSSMLPRGTGGVIWFEYDYQNQHRNWSGDSRAPAANNDDKAIRTDFFQIGIQYLFNRSWGVEAQVPVDRRFFKSEEDGAVSSTEWTTLGDIRLKGLYTGFFEDQSLGVDFGVKLPTGDFTHDGADRDTQIGTGSTDILLGGYYRTQIAPKGNWDAFLQVETDLPVLIRDSYRPGVEIDGAAGIYYTGWSIGDLQIVPIGQVIVSERTSDSGANAAHPVASGYQRILLSPGVEFRFHQISVYGDAEFPVFQHMTGDQLVAPALFKVIVGYSF